MDLFSRFHLLLRAVVVAPTKEERVFHSGSAESSVIMHTQAEGPYDTRPSHIHPLQVSKRKPCGANPSRRRDLRRPRTCLAVSCDSGGRRWRIRVTGVFPICLRTSLARQTKSSSVVKRHGVCICNATKNTLEASTGKKWR